MPGALQGLKIVEMAGIGPAPFAEMCCRIMAPRCVAGAAAAICSRPPGCKVRQG